MPQQQDSSRMDIEKGLLDNPPGGNGGGPSPADLPAADDGATLDASSGDPVSGAVELQALRNYEQFDGLAPGKATVYMLGKAGAGEWAGCNYSPAGAEQPATAGKRACCCSCAPLLKRMLGKPRFNHGLTLAGATRGRAITAGRTAALALAFVPLIVLAMAQIFAQRDYMDKLRTISDACAQQQVAPALPSAGSWTHSDSADDGCVTDRVIIAFVAYQLRSAEIQDDYQVGWLLTVYLLIGLVIAIHHHSPAIHALFVSRIVEPRALRNYEEFHRLARGQATTRQVRESSAGVSGWSGWGEWLPRCYFATGRDMPQGEDEKPGYTPGWGVKPGRNSNGGGFGGVKLGRNSNGGGFGGVRKSRGGGFGAGRKSNTGFGGAGFGSSIPEAATAFSFSFGARTPATSTAHGQGNKDGGFSFGGAE